MYKKIIKLIGGIILAIKETVKGHCGDSKCTYDVYTKEKVDELLGGNYATVNVTTKWQNGYQVDDEGYNQASVIVNYPEGFNKDNTYVVTTKVTNEGGAYNVSPAHFFKGCSLSVQLGANDMEVFYDRPDLLENNFSGTISFEMLLLKR